MPFSIDPVVDVAINSVVESAAVTMTDLIVPTNIEIGYDSTPVTLTGAVLIINGVDSGTTSSISNGDTLAIRGTSSASYATASFASVTIVTFATVVFGVMTEQNPATIILDPLFSNKPSSELFADYTPSTPDNTFIRVDAAANTTIENNIVSVASVNPATLNDGISYVFTTDQVEGKLHRIHPTTGVVVQSIDIAGAFDVVFTPTNGIAANTVAHTIVSSPSDNAVYVYDGLTHVLQRTAATGAGPHGVAGAATTVLGDYGFWVACTDADRVEYWEYAAGTTLLRKFFYSLDAGSKPYHVAVDANGNAHFTCLGTNKVAKCNADGVSVVTYIDVGIDPWTITINNNYAYVACAGSDTVVAINLSSNSTTSLSVLVNPTHVEIAGNKLFVGSFNYGTLASYPLTSDTSIGAPTSIASQRMIDGTGVSSDASTVYVNNMWNDSPIRTALPDNTPSPFSFASRVGVSPDSLTQSSTVIITGITAGPGVISVPDIYGMTLFINGIPMGVSATIQDGDQVDLSFTSPDTSVSLFVPIMLEGAATIWVISMTPGANPKVSGWIQGG